MKSVQIRSFFWSVFYCFRSEHRKIRTRKNSVFGYFSRSVSVYASTMNLVSFYFFLYFYNFFSFLLYMFNFIWVHLVEQNILDFVQIDLLMKIIGLLNTLSNLFDGDVLQILLVTRSCLLHSQKNSVNPFVSNAPFLYL